MPYVDDGHVENIRNVANFLRRPLFDDHELNWTIWHILEKKKLILYHSGKITCTGIRFLLKALRRIRLPQLMEGQCKNKAKPATSAKSESCFSVASDTVQTTIKNIYKMILTWNFLACQNKLLFPKICV